MNQVDINYADFRRLDLNLLVAFDALLEERHVGRAAERLFIGQPAMSHALARLRALLGDELFVRTGKGMEPTARALELGPRVRAWLAESADLLLHHERFDPAQAEGLIRLSVPDGIEALVLPPLVAMLRVEAPRVRLRVQLLEVDQLLGALDDDEVDIVVAAMALPLRSWHQRLPLMSSAFNYLYAADQVDLPRPASMAQIAACDHVVSSHRGEIASIVDQYFEARGLSRRVVVSSASMIAVSQILKRAPLVSIQPAIYAALHDLSGLVVEPLRAEPPLALSIDMIWHGRHDQQPLQRYLRGKIADIAAALGSAP